MAIEKSQGVAVDSGHLVWYHILLDLAMSADVQYWP